MFQPRKRQRRTAPNPEPRVTGNHANGRKVIHALSCANAGPKVTDLGLGLD
jgi:hypothetical protein